MTIERVLRISDLQDGGGAEITTDRRFVFIDLYEEPTKWGYEAFFQALTPAQAREIAAALVRAAEMVEGS